MEFKIRVQDTVTKKYWIENYNKNTDDPESLAADWINNFNESLRPHENPRRLVKVIILSTENTNHKFVKSMVGMSSIFRGSIVDIYYCEKCGITAKRYGMAGSITQ